MQRDGFTCQCCKDTETTLNVHHLKYTKNNIWEEPSENLVTVCEHCHVELENIKKAKVEFSNIKIFKSISPDFRTMFLCKKNTILVQQYYKHEDVVSIVFDKDSLVHLNFIVNNFVLGGNNG